MTRARAYRLQALQAPYIVSKETEALNPHLESRAPHMLNPEKTSSRDLARVAAGNNCHMSLEAKQHVLFKTAACCTVSIAAWILQTVSGQIKRRQCLERSRLSSSLSKP